MRETATIEGELRRAVRNQRIIEAATVALAVAVFVAMTIVNRLTILDSNDKIEELAGKVASSELEISRLRAILEANEIVVPDGPMVIPRALVDPPQADAQARSPGREASPVPTTARRADPPPPGRLGADPSDPSPTSSPPVEPTPEPAGSLDRLAELPGEILGALRRAV